MLYRVTFQVSYLKKTVDPSGIILQVPVIDCIADEIYFIVCKFMLSFAKVVIMYMFINYL